MPIKESIETHFDLRRDLFQNIVGSLELFSRSTAWDLSWGEPFIALSEDRKLWIRVFYEDSLSITAEKLHAEIKRLSPHIAVDGELALCLPEIWASRVRKESFCAPFKVTLWSYSSPSGNEIVTREVEKPVSAPTQVTGSVQKPIFKAELEERLSPDEIRELTDIGVEIRRYKSRKV